MISNKIIAKESFMELVYLWVEDYKNIQKQGFNFSPRFRCEYDEKTEKLSVVDKEKTGEFYPKNFFGDNINVTAIVGENGSGKSNIFKQLNEILLNKYWSKGLVLIIFENNIMKILNLSNLKIEFGDNNLFEKEYFESTENFFNSNIFYYSSSIFDRNYYPQKEIFKYFGFLDFGELSQKYIINKSIENIIFLFKNLDEKYFKELNLILSKEIALSPKELTNEKVKGICLYFNHHQDIEKLISKKLKNVNYDEKRDFLLAYLWIILFYKFQETDTKLLDFFNTKEFSENLFMQKIEDYYLKEKPILIKFIDKFIEISNKELSYTKKDLKLNLNKYFWINISDCDEEFLVLLDKIDISELFDLNWIMDLEIRNMSSGEILILDLLAKIYKYIKENKESTLFLFDEIEALLHPEWQRKYLNLINKMITLFSENEKYHLIFATHSPFIISDLPKENIIFLEKGKQVYPFEDGKQTFGANIHTLLSHGFFMKDGLMGEFAKDKIKSIINYHEEIKELTKEEKKSQRDIEKEKYEKENKTKFWQIQSIIGDDYLKQVIKNHLIEIEKIVLGNDEAKKEEVKRLKAQIELLEK